MRKLLRVLCLLLALVFLFAACDMNDELPNDNNANTSTPPTTDNSTTNSPTDDAPSTGSNPNNGSSPAQDPALLSTEHYNVTAGMMSYMVFSKYQDFISIYGQFFPQFPSSSIIGGGEIVPNSNFDEPLSTSVIISGNDTSIIDGVDTPIINGGDTPISGTPIIDIPIIDIPTIDAPTIDIPIFNVPIIGGSILFPINGGEGGNRLDQTKPLREQIYSSKTDEHGNVTQKTWFDYFAEMAQADVREILACCENARVYNITLSNADLSAVESEMDTINFYASLYGYTANQYIKAMYGECVEPKDVRSMLELLQLSNKWRDLKRKAFFDDVTDARVEAYYLANKNIYDVYCDFTSYTFVTSFTPSSNNTENENNAAKYQAEQERFAEYVQTLNQATDALDFRMKLYNCLLAEECLQKEEQKGSALTENEQTACAQAAQAKVLAAMSKNKCADDEGEYEEYLYEWLFESTTEDGVKVYLHKVGDINKFERIEDAVDEASGIYREACSVYTAACFNAGMHRNSGVVRSVGHILFKADTFDGLTSTENLTGATKEIADTVLARDGVITARAMAFELLNMLYTEGKITEGTLQDGSKYYKIDKSVFEEYGWLYTEDSSIFYDNVYKGQMVQEFEDWLFDEKRQEGEISYTDPVETTYGYHIMYYAGNEAEAWKSEIREEICQSDYITWFETVLNTTTYTNGDPTLWDQIK